MHIAFVNNTENWGGVKTWCISMARSLREAGHQSVVFGKDSVFIEKVQLQGVTGVCYAPGPDFNPVAIRFYARYFKQHQIDAVIVNVGKDIRTAGIAAKLLGIPIIHRVGAPQDFKNSWKKRLEISLLNPAFLCCSQYVLDSLQNNVPCVQNHTGIAIHPGTPIPQGIDFTVTRPLKLITTSRLSPDKKHMDLLEAAVRLREDKLPFHLTIVGEGAERKRLETFVQENSLQEQVCFTGFTTDVGAQLRMAHVFVLPTWKEPLGIALEEAMAHGLIPVARRAGGVPEIWPPSLPELLIEQQAGAHGFYQVLSGLMALGDEQLGALRHEVQAHAVAAFSQQKQFAVFSGWLQQVIQGQVGRP